jgi:hypothetical protein
MRVPFSVFWLVGLLLVATPTQAEKRIFIISSNVDGYGVDRCLATGASCGKAMATAYCRAQDFDKALSFRRIERADITGAVPAGTSCRGACDDFVAIECGR